MRVKDRVIFITGASRGIGRAVALACAREGVSNVVRCEARSAVELDDVAPGARLRLVGVDGALRSFAFTLE